jgi:alpha-tubulin suppressor-like RCC1 family protein
LASIITAFTILFSASGAQPAAAACEGTPAVSTDKPDYGPTETGVISGSGFNCGVQLSVLVIAPDGSTFSGDGTGSPGADFVITDQDGTFSLSYQLFGTLPGGDTYEGQLGTYSVSVLDQSDTVLASTSFDDSLGSFSCALTTSGGVKCWGSNTYGQLGNGTADPSHSVGSTTPVDVIGLANGVAQISVGLAHACALTTNGGVKCWGDNSWGELGEGRLMNPRTTPVDVSGLTSGVVQVSAGAFSTCAVLTSGALKCWGNNVYGQLGDGTQVMRTTPVNVIGLAGVAQVSVGDFHTCAVTTSGGVKCWGYNTYGWLGDGTSTNSTTPVNVVGLMSGVVRVAAGGLMTCAVTESGGVKCWGHNFFGELGDGTNTSSAIPVNVSGLATGVDHVSLGYEHACAVTAGGSAKCWGSDGFGKLGNGGSNSSSSTPVDVSGLTSDVVQISTGYHHTCALTTTGGVKCWGNNNQRAGG